jgi:hypothetical protein
MTVRSKGGFEMNIAGFAQGNFVFTKRVETHEIGGLK